MNRTAHLERIISKPNAMHSILVVQVVQNSDCNHNVGIFESRVALDRIAYCQRQTSPLSPVRPPGKRNITGGRCRAQYIRRRADFAELAPEPHPIIDHFITRSGLGHDFRMILRRRRVPSNDILEKGCTEMALSATATIRSYFACFSPA